MKTQPFEDVLHFWFPQSFDQDQATLVRQFHWWFRGGGNADIIQQFSPLLEQGIRGELDDWSYEPRSRQALIIVLDQFSRTIHQGTAQHLLKIQKLAHPAPPSPKKSAALSR